MPLYEYECENCGNRFEQIQKFSDPPLEVCPKCGAGPVRKLMSSPAIQFKGSGWYITDYARKDGGGGSKAGTDAAASKKDGTSSSGASADAKTTDSSAAKSETKTDAKPSNP